MKPRCHNSSNAGRPQPAPDPGQRLSATVAGDPPARPMAPSGDTWHRQIKMKTISGARLNLSLPARGERPDPNLERKNNMKLMTPAADSPEKHNNIRDRLTSLDREQLEIAFIQLSQANGGLRLLLAIYGFSARDLDRLSSRYILDQVLPASGPHSNQRPYPISRGVRPAAA